MEPKRMKANITKCTSCGHRHPHLEFTPIEFPVVDPPHSDEVWTHYAICPNTQHRILIREVNPGEDPDGVQQPEDGTPPNEE